MLGRIHSRILASKNVDVLIAYWLLQCVVMIWVVCGAMTLPIVVLKVINQSV
jgi:hypothetical protein